MKKKERTLSIEELKEKTIKEKNSFWFHSEPLFNLVQTQNNTAFLSLHASTESNLMVIFLLDAADYTSDRVMELLGLWRNRYKALNWKETIIFKQKYTFIKTSKFFEHYRNQAHFPHVPIYIDTLGDFHEWAKTEGKPTLLMINQGQLVYHDTLLPDFEGQVLKAEVQLQDALRLDDPGLPLPLLYHYEISAPIDSQIISKKEVTLTGQWSEDQDALATDDPKSALTFPFEGKHLRIIADLHPQAREPGRVRITLNDQPLPRNLSSGLIHTDDKGNTFFEVHKSVGIFDLIHTQASTQGIVKLHFYSVVENPIIFYELRVG